MASRRGVSMATALCGTVAFLAACAGPHDLEWGARFESTADRERAHLVELRILREGCGGAPLYEATLDPNGSNAPPRPPELDAGGYGFAGRARDANCVWFAETCIDQALPTTEGVTRIVLTLVSGAETAECPPAECDEGWCQGEIRDAGTDAPATDAPAVDGGPPPEDGGNEDGGRLDGGRMDGCSASTEVCNGRDDDCDRNTDEGSDSMLCGDSLASCASGSCACMGGITYDPGGRRCLDTSRDPRNCGSVGRTCESYETCADGACTCRPGLDRVSSGECVDFDTDPRHCGSEGNDCSTMGSMRTCRRTCEDACNGAAGQTNCSNACVILSTSPFHCGACDNACAVDEVCVSGTCRHYGPALLCASCPCTSCSGDTCCTYGGDDICVSGTSSCPP